VLCHFRSLNSIAKDRCRQPRLAFFSMITTLEVLVHKIVNVKSNLISLIGLDLGFLLFVIFRATVMRAVQLKLTEIRKFYAH
jgi:hypothetical protein